MKPYRSAALYVLIGMYGLYWVLCGLGGDNGFVFNLGVCFCMGVGISVLILDARGYLTLQNMINRKHWIFAILAFIVFPLWLGAYFAVTFFAYRRPPLKEAPPRKSSKVALLIGTLTTLFVYVLMATGAIATSRPMTNVSRASNTVAATQQTAETARPSPTENPTEQKTQGKVVQPTPTQEPTPKPVQKWNVTAASTIVKQVNGKHRYFFDIRNHDSKPWSGSVTIELYNDMQQTPQGFETFETTKPMEPQLGVSVYFDINTGPPSVHGSYGITHFKYTVKINGTQVNKGEGKISNRYEA